MSKHVRILIGITAISSILLSCDSSDSVKEAENEVFAIHDEVMPKIDNILKLQKQLKQRIHSLDSLDATGSASTTLRTDEEKEQAVRLNNHLKVADSLMMNWMGKYNGDTLSKLSTDDALKYLAAQKDQINDVKTKVNSSIQQAKQFLDKK